MSAAHKTFLIEQAKDLARFALVANGTAAAVADAVAHALVMSDADGIRSHGLERIPSYVVQLRSHKVDGNAEPTRHIASPCALAVNANGGFSYPALNEATQWLPDAADRFGIAIAAVSKSHHCGVAGHPVERLARKGLVGMMFANTPKAIAPHGSSKAVFGTNPIAFSCPRVNADPIVIDLSVSIVARGKIKLAADNDESIPIGWAIDRFGQPTSDPSEGLAGTLLPLGGAKGSALALMGELLAAGMTGSNFGYEASSFFDDQGQLPGVGQLLLALKPGLFEPGYARHNESLFEQMQSQDDVRLPGQRRFASRRRATAEGLSYREELVNEIKELALL